MLNTEKLKDKHVLVIGYALTGKSVAEFLNEHQVQVTINDRGNLSEDPSVSLLLDQGIRIVDGSHPLSLLDEEIDFIVKNPGIPYNIPIIEAAIEKEIPIYTDVELASWFSEANIIGITGSNGKSTTTSLVYELLKNRSKGQAYLAGNIGVPTLSVVKEATKLDDIVMELSSFQLAGTQKFHPHIAIITNIYEAHLDYHHNRKHYIDAKLNLISNMTKHDILIYRYDEGELSDWVKDCPARKIPFSIKDFSLENLEHSIYLKNQMIYYENEAVLSISDIQIPGEHNIENIMAAIAVAKVKGVSTQSIQETIRGYQGMRHRIQPVIKLSERSFYNDSKATNITATITALNSFTQPIRYIGGGLDRGNEFDELVPYLNNVVSAHLYGETKHKMKNAFTKASVNHVDVHNDLVEATQAAYYAAQRGEVVLLSPSCASWDQFKTFEERGDLFINTVNELARQKPYSN